MSALSRIRSRAGLLVAVIGIALLAFILGDIFTSGRSIFSGRETTVGVVAGDEISYIDFEKKVEDQLEQARKGNPNAPPPDEAKKDQVVQTTWQQTISEKIFTREFDKLGIVVSSDELTDQMVGREPNQVMSQYFSDQQTGQVLRQYARPDGKLNVVEVRKYMIGMNEEAEKNWIQLEKYIRDTRKQTKYMDLIKKGLYITTVQAKQDSADAASVYSIRYVARKYNAQADSAIKINDSDRLTWYNAHQYKYKVKEAVRSIDYVVYDIAPSRRDVEESKAEMQKLMAEFKTKTGKEDTAFVVGESESRAYKPRYVKKGSLDARVDSIVAKGVTGTVAGPVDDGNKLTIYKVLDKKISADSAKVRHLLVTYKGAARADSTVRRSKEQAKKMADSILVVVKSKKKKLEDLVPKLTDDPGSKDTPDGKPGNRGDYGWFTEESGFVQAFKDAGLQGKKGQLSVVETEFGFHVIEVIDKTKETPKVKIVTIEHQEVPSKATIDSIYLRATAFAGKNTNAELFGKAVVKENMNKLVAADIHATDHMIRGLESPKELVRWMFADDRKKGDVSQPYQLGERFVVACLTGIKEKGVAPLDEVKDKVDSDLRKQKKAEKSMEELAKAETGVTRLEDLGTKLREPVQNAENLSFANSFIPGCGQENEVAGAITGLKEGTLSKPIQGNSGVFILMIEKVNKGMAQDTKTLKKQSLANLQSRADGDVFEALKENAKIKDNRAKFY